MAPGFAAIEPAPRLELMAQGRQASPSSRPLRNKPAVQFVQLLPPFGQLLVDALLQLIQSLAQLFFSPATRLLVRHL